jgi:hypothetical protein
MLLVGLLIAMATACSDAAANDRPTGGVESLEQVVRAPRLPAKLPAASRLGPTIPGLENDAFPQGLAYLPDQDWFLISLYHRKKKEKVPDAAFVVAVDCKTERVTRCRRLKDENGRPHAGHVGGIAVHGTSLWIASGADMYRMPVEAIVAGEKDDEATIAKVFRPVSNASFVACHERVLWVGNFYKKATPENSRRGEPSLTRSNGEPVRGVLAGYPLDRHGDLEEGARSDQKMVPKFVISLPEKVQGVTFHQDTILVSTSYGRSRNSKLLALPNPLTERVERPSDHVTFSSGEQRPLWFLPTPKQSDAVKLITLPPMAEGIAVRNETLAILFESGATQYRSSSSAWLDRLVYLPLADVVDNAAAP